MKKIVLVLILMCSFVGIVNADEITFGELPDKLRASMTYEEFLEEGINCEIKITNNSLDITCDLKDEGVYTTHFDYDGSVLSYNSRDDLTTLEKQFDSLWIMQLVNNGDGIFGSYVDDTGDYQTTMKKLSELVQDVNASPSFSMNIERGTIIEDNEIPGEGGNTNPPDDGEKPNEGENTNPPDDGEKPNEGENTNPPDDGEKPNEGENTNPPDDGEKPNEGENTNPPDDGEKPNEGENTNPPDDGEKPNEGENTTPPDDGEKPNEGENTNPPDDGEKPNGGENTNPPDDGEKPNEGENTNSSGGNINYNPQTGNIIKFCIILLVVFGGAILIIVYNKALDKYKKM